MFNPQDEFDESVNKRAKMQSLYASVAYITIMGRIKKDSLSKNELVTLYNNFVHIHKILFISSLADYNWKQFVQIVRINLDWPKLFILQEA